MRGDDHTPRSDASVGRLSLRDLLVRGVVAIERIAAAAEAIARGGARAGKVRGVELPACAGSSENAATTVAVSATDRAAAQKAVRERARRLGMHVRAKE